MLRQVCSLFLLLSIFFFCGTSAFGETVTVQGGTIADIQNAVNGAAAGDIIVVPDGIYTATASDVKPVQTGGNDRWSVLDFNGKAITLESANGPANCVIDGSNIVLSGTSGMSFRAQDCSRVDGFTIRNFPKGIFIKASPVISNCIITGNFALFTSGGGIEIWDGSPTITGCIITQNHTGFWGGGIFAYFGEDRGQPIIRNCTISKNSANKNGGGIAMGNHITPFNPDPSPIISNCIITGNRAEDYGGGIYSKASMAQMTNCTIADNWARYGGGIATADSYYPTLTNCILWNTNGGEVFYWSERPVIKFSDIQGGYLGSGNINENPLFADATNEDYHLQPGSPCINNGYNEASSSLPATDIDGNPRIVDTIVDMGAYELQIPTSTTRYVGTDETYKTIKSAIDDARSGDRILVRDGIYSGPDLSWIWFYGKQIMVRSENGPRNCILDGSGSEPGSSLFSFDGNEKSTTVLSGFTIRNFNSDSVIDIYLSSPSISNCVFYGNTGRSLYVFEGAPIISNCIINNCSAPTGPALFGSGFAGLVRNCTIYGNTATGGGVIDLGNSSSPTITNSILWGNSGDAITYQQSTPTIAYSNIQGGFTGAGNINVDPLFVAPVNRDLRLRAGSPCIDTGANSVWSSSATDIDGNPRMVGGRVDMGAYEYHSSYPAWINLLLD